MSETTYEVNGKLTGKLYKERYILDHNALSNRDLDDQHPISSIAGLAAALGTIQDTLNDHSETLTEKVDKVIGKGLSTNDFTNALKTKLNDIETGAEVNIIETIKLDGAALTPDGNRAVDIPVDDTLEQANTPADSKAVGDAIDELKEYTDEAVADLEERKFNYDGYSDSATVANAEQIISTKGITDTEPYIYRKTGGPNDVGDRVYDEIVGGSVVWNQLVANGNFSDGTRYWAFSGEMSASNNELHFTANETYNTVNGYFRCIEGHKYIGFASVKITSGQAIVLFYPGAYSRTSVTNSFEVLSGIFVGGADNNYNFPRIQDLRTENFDTVSVKDVHYHDLTATFGSTIADYIYTLETTNVGAGVKWFKKHFPNVYYNYVTPHFEHVQVSAKNTVEFNQWDEEWELGQFNNQTGEPIAATDCIRSKNFIDVLPNVAYANNGYDGTMQLFFYDADKSYIGYYWVSTTVTSPSNARYMKFRMASSYGTTYKNDICINLSGDRDGEYKPYRKRTYPIEPKVLRGVLKLDSANRIYFDGDVMRHDGTVTRRYGVYTYDGSESWLTYDYNGKTSFRLPNNAVKTNSGNCITDKGFEYSQYAWASTTWKFVTPYSGYLYFRDPSIETLADWKASLQANPVTVVCELKEPTTETAEPFQAPMVVDPLGTEEFIDYGVEQGTRDVAIPVGHTSMYPADLKGKLEHLPSLASADGRYCVQQSGDQMTLVADTSPGLIAALEARVAALENK